MTAATPPQWQTSGRLLIDQGIDDFLVDCFRSPQKQFGNDISNEFLDLSSNDVYSDFMLIQSVPVATGKVWRVRRIFAVPGYAIGHL